MSTKTSTILKEQRLSNFELLRVFAILLISIMHGSSVTYGSQNIVNNITHVCINAIGNTGVTLFVLISGYFSIRFRASKVWKLWSTMLFYSLLFFAIQCYLHEIIIPNTGSIKDFLKQLYVAFTPATSNTWWFCTSYIIVLLISPFLNKITECISKHEFQCLLAILLFFYSLSPTFLMHSLSGSPNGKCTENMILAYFIGRYCAIYGIPRMIQQYATIIFFICFSMIFIIDYFVFDPLFLCKDHSVFIILEAICIFHFFGKLKIESQKASNRIRCIAGFVFPFYLLNTFLINHLEFQLAGLSNSPRVLLYIALIQIEILIIAFIVENVRRLLMGHFEQTISTYLDKKFYRLF